MSKQGRFVMELPKKESQEKLVDMKRTALRSLIRAKLRLEYRKFMKEYEVWGTRKYVQNIFTMIILSHTCTIHSDSTTQSYEYFIKHFYDRPKIVIGFHWIFMRFRSYDYVYKAIIVTMYRQVLVSVADWNLQLIFWREKPENEVQVYRLCTLTYEMASASYLVQKCLKVLDATSRS